MKRERSFTKGITLISLVITVIVLLILAGVAITMALDANGLFPRAQYAKDSWNNRVAEEESAINNALLILNEIEIASLKEKTQLEVNSAKMNDSEITTSDIIADLKEKNIIDEDMNFVQNNAYSLRYCGDIVYDNEVVDTLNLSENETSLEIEKTQINSACELERPRTIKCIDGRVEKYLKDNIECFKLYANPAKEGKKFGYWVDKYNNIVSYRENGDEYGTAIIDNIYIPVYVDTDEEIEKKDICLIYGTNQTVGQYLVFSSYIRCFENVETKTSLYGGILATNDIELANEENLVHDTSNTKIYNRRR